MINVLLSVKLLSFKGKQADKQTVTHHTNIVADGQLRVKEGESSRVMWDKKTNPLAQTKREAFMSTCQFCTLQEGGSCFPEAL